MQTNAIPPQHYSVSQQQSEQTQSEDHFVSERLTHLEQIVEKIGYTVLSSSEAVEKLAKRVDALAVQIQHQNHQIEQQGLSVFALTDAVQTLVDHQTQSQVQLQQMTQSLRHLVITLNPKNRRHPSSADVEE